MERPDPGVAEELEPGVRRVLAPNPSPMTFWGTNTYLVGAGSLAVIDPGPDDDRHLTALLEAIGGAPVSHILVTHAHRDHAPLAARLSRETGAQVLAFGRPGDGRRPVMADLAASGLTGGGEGVDAGFSPDARLGHGDTVAGDGWRLTALHTPGHMASHLSFAMDDIVFTGDHVMGWASSLVSPPDGDLLAFMETSRTLRDRPARVFHAGHGAPVTDPAGRLDWLIAHREARERAILGALSNRPATIEAITRAVYTDVAPELLPAAARNVFAHLIALQESGRAHAEPRLSATARFRSV